MSKLSILEFPDPRLRIKAKPVPIFDPALRQLAADMLETMYDAGGIGLAATQVGIPKQLIVMDLSEERNQPKVLVNPRVTALTDERRGHEEGCLSVPDFKAEVSRPTHIRVQAWDLDGQSLEFQPQGLEAVCIQHEVDHLQGKLFVDYLSTLKRNRIRSKLVKQRQLS